MFFILSLVFKLKSLFKYTFPKYFSAVTCFRLKLSKRSKWSQMSTSRCKLPLTYIRFNTFSSWWLFRTSSGTKCHSSLGSCTKARMVQYLTMKLMKIPGVSTSSQMLKVGIHSTCASHLDQMSAGVNIILIILFSKMNGLLLDLHMTTPIEKWRFMSMG